MEFLTELARAIQSGGLVHALRLIQIVKRDVSKTEVLAHELLRCNFLRPVQNSSIIGTMMSNEMKAAMKKNTYEVKALMLSKIQFYCVPLAFAGFNICSSSGRREAEFMALRLLPPYDFAMAGLGDMVVDAFCCYCVKYPLSSFIFHY